MSTESISDRRKHIRSISVTAMTALVGVGAAFICAIWIGLSSEAAADPRALFLVVGAILAQIPVLNSTGLYSEDEVGIKHYLFVAFMTFSMWFVTWGILMTAEAA